MKRNLILAALALLATPANAQDIAGDWQGTIKTGMGELRLVVHVAKNADGTLKALVDSPDQNAPGVPIDSITLVANKVRFSSAALKASYGGTLKSGDSISGRWTQEQKIPLDFKKTTSPLKTVHKPAAPSDIIGHRWQVGRRPRYSPGQVAARLPPAEYRRRSQGNDG